MFSFGAVEIVPKIKEKVPDLAILDVMLQDEDGYEIVKKIRQSPKVCVFIENMDYQNPNQFGYGIVSGFRKMAEAENWTVDVHAVTPDFQRVHAYDFFMMREGYQASFVLGFTLLDPWMAEFHQTRFPTVLYDNYINKMYI